MQIGFVRSAVVLGLLACVGPFAVDLYLPALPRIAEDLGTTVAAAQFTFTAYFLAFGVAQLVYGPLADWVGRKPPIYAGLVIFIAGSVVCAVAPDIIWLTVGRFVQALGAAAVMVIPRAVVRDLHTGADATRLMALIMLVISISPMLAPLTGSAIIAVGSWRLIFVALAVAALVAMALTALQLPETLTPDKRVPMRAGAMLRGCGALLRDGRFLGLTFIGGFGMASFFVFIASAAFVYTAHYGLSPTGFSLAFALNAIGFFATSQLAAGMGKRFGMARAAFFAVLGFAVSACLLLVLVALGNDSLWLVMALLFLANAFMGLVIAPTMVMALDEHGDNAGLASSLGGTLQMVAGGLMIVVSGPFFDGTVLPMVGAIAVCSLLSLLAAALTLGPDLRRSVPA
ncbi:multidrug effflux MFS transporter [Pannonibacter tanglangensis]|uniref:Bcr/CflA family efflux transporter n=1 Tax=Pannonibacter tanglangensis TaxID=2750084 RepID=A0ABW9ZLZ7_9HYPH|nr:multidrug effflux MFS transporter [Pannonibacter sp. XCT-34]NBN65900.1 Bcr/CflA family efflux MFS transporter [Pannonibacter sp. XCT-34]